MSDAMQSATPQGGAAEDQSHIDAMVARAEEGVTSIRAADSRTGETYESNSQDNQEPEAEAKPQRPEDIPEKFWDSEKGEVNVAALLKAQQDAEAALRRQQQEKPEESDDSSESSEETPSQATAIDNATAEFAEKGELTDETYESLQKVGISRDMVDAYIRGQQAAVGEIEQAAFNAFDGTREAYQEAIQWAAQNLDEDQIAAIDLQLTSMNPAIVKQGAATLANLYNQNADVMPSNRITGNGNDSVTGSYFKSSHEMTKAMSDPRYARDAAYRQEVEQKIKNASARGVDLFI